MNRISTLLFAALLSPAALVPHVAFAAGSAARMWVSASTGVDVAGCGGVSNPCRFFQYALDNVVASGGTIGVVGPGGYGAVNITFPVSIINEGVGMAGIFGANATGNAVDINLLSGGQVTLKGLTIDGTTTGMNGNGVDMKSTGTLTMANCTVTEFKGSSATGNGTLIRPTSGTANFHISDSTFSGNAYGGVFIVPGFPATGAASASGEIRNVTASDNNLGVVASTFWTSGTVNATVEDSLASHNSDAGIDANGANTTVRINRVNATRNITDLVNTGTLTSLGTNLYDTKSGTISTAPLR